MAKTDSEKETRDIIEKAMEMGVRFYENAWRYAGGRAEEMYGKYLVPKYRDQIFLLTKNKGTTAEEARNQHEDSKRRMKTDVFDCVYMHHLEDPDDVDKRVAGGTLEFLLKMQQKGEIRHLGFSSHKLTATHKHFVEKVAGKDPFVATQFPINPLDPSKPDSYIKELLPWIQKTGYAIMGMKTMAHGRFFANNRDKWPNDDPIIPNYLSVEEVIWFVLSQPITAIVSGTDRLEQVEQNVKAAWDFAALTRNDRVKIVAEVAKFNKTVGLEYYRPQPEG